MFEMYDRGTADAAADLVQLMKEVDQVRSLSGDSEDIEFEDAAP